MPKFRVFKGQDAWVVYSTVVEADTQEEAEQLAMSRSHSGPWTYEDDVREFDHAILMEGETEIVNEGEENGKTA